MAAVVWLPVLLVAEIASRRFAYDRRRWSTVFLFGMYAVCSFAVADVTGIGGLVDFGPDLGLGGVHPCAIVFAAMVGRGVVVARTGRASTVAL